jgi:hypothetical protein
MFQKINVSLAIFLVCFIMIIGNTNINAQVDSTTLNGVNITSVLSLNSSTRYIMKSFCYVKNGGTIVIPPGTIIQGDKGDINNNVLPGCLIVERGGKINAVGTASQPIIFTTRQAPGNRGPGDWAGIILLGKASINTVGGSDTNAIEGMPTNVTPLYYGGHTDDDSSGVMKYVRIECPGINLTGVSGNEINGLTLGGVGSKTVIDYIQVSYSGDDSYEWFGGTVNCRHLIAYKGTDDNFDTDNGFRGKCQYLLCILDSNICDFGSGGASNGYESDNNANSPSNFNAPRTKPIFCNVTLVGPYKTLTTTVAPCHQRGCHIRRNSQLNSFNSIYMGFRVGVRFDGTGVANECTGDTVRFKNNIWAGCLTLADTASMNGSGFNGTNWLNTPAFSNRVYNVNDSVRLTNPYGNEIGGNWVPLAGSPALTGASFSDPNLSGFDVVTYVGAFGSENWATGWTNFNPLTYIIGIQQISSEVPAKFNLSQNYPNPFNPVTNIKFDMPNSGYALLKVYNAAGEEVKTLVNQQLNVGTYKVNFDGSNFASGVYFYRINVKDSKNNEMIETKKMILVK